MMQPASGVAPAPAPPMPQQPPMAQQPPPMAPQYYQTPPPQYYQAPPPPMWNQQPSQVPPPAPVPPPPQAVQMPVPAQYQAVPQSQPPPQPQPQPQQQPQYASAVPMATSQQPQQAEDIRTLWIGDLQYWMEESYLHSCFYTTGEVLSIKVIRNKHTGMSEGYGFIEFSTRATAERVLQTYNGQLMPNVEQKFRLNWATLGAGEKRELGPDYSIFVGDLAADVTDTTLLETFKTHYPSVRSAKVVIDRLTGCSKGYGFVKFGDATEQARAMTEMNGMFCSTRRMRIGPATNKKNADSQQDTTKASYSSIQASQSESDPNNTTIFVGALDQNVTDDQLRQVFGQYGDLVHVKIPLGKRCGFVQFATRACAEEALLMLNGTQLGGQNIRLSWGRSPANKQAVSQQDPNQWNGGGYYGYGQGYQSYGYTQPAQDPNMQAYGAYSAYPNYQQQQ